MLKARVIAIAVTGIILIGVTAPFSRFVRWSEAAQDKLLDKAEILQKIIRGASK